MLPPCCTVMSIVGLTAVWFILTKNCCRLAELVSVNDPGVFLTNWHDMHTMYHISYIMHHIWYLTQAYVSDDNLLTHFRFLLLSVSQVTEIGRRTIWCWYQVGCFQIGSILSNKKGEIQIGIFKFFKGGRSDGKTDVNVGEILGRYKKKTLLEDLDF